MLQLLLVRFNTIKLNDKDLLIKVMLDLTHEHKDYTVIGGHQSSDYCNIIET